MSEPQKHAYELSASVNRLATEFYAAVGNLFPISAVSDEFYFFPQVLPAERNWANWDDFSAARVAEFSVALRDWERQLDRLSACPQTEDNRIDIRMLRHSLRTLREQLTDVAPQKTQPTYHLTIVVAGLGEALSSADPQAWAERIAGLPGFLQRAADCLFQVPEPFLVMGRQMLADLLSWLARLQAEGRSLGQAITALQQFGVTLTQLKRQSAFRLPLELAERIFEEHMTSGLDCSAALALLEQELVEMATVLRVEAEQLTPGLNWQEAAERLPVVTPSTTNPLALYRRELAGLEQHCRSTGLVGADLPADTGLSVARVPASLAAIRASDAYNAEPGFPARGGIFYVQRKHLQAGGGLDLTPEYRMTAAHETWPGHHLLDWSRWSLQNALRRPLESPLFYEGWACLAEELMARTGYFDQPWDRFILARRRLKRAARGKVDLGLQTGRMSFPEAVDCLQQVGFSANEVHTIIPKYLLRPGYQVCYTLGLRRFLELLDSYSTSAISVWVEQMLAHGEIPPDELDIKLTEALRR